MSISSFPKVNPTPNFGLFRAGYIYVLKCPETELVRYVGKSFSLKSRIHDHLRSNKKERSKRVNWIKGLLIRGKKPILDIIDDCDEFNWEEKERNYIKLYKSCGAKLLNMTNGGEAGCLNFNHEEETRRRISEKMKAHKKSDDHNKNVSSAIKNKWHSDSDYRESQIKRNMEKISNMTPAHRVKAGMMKSKMAKMPIDEKIKMCDNIRLEISNGRRRTDIAVDFGISYGILKDLIKKY